MDAKSTSFVPLNNDSIRKRVIALGLKRVTPESGVEKHFLMALDDPRRISCLLEREWVDYFKEFTSMQPVPEPEAPQKKPVIYPKQEFIPATRVENKKPSSLIDLAVVAANLGNNIHSIKQITQDPLVKEAIEMTTNNSLEELASSPERLSGTIATAKGKYFELLVRDQLNSGASFGDISLTNNQLAALADKLNQPGWDIAITDSDGHVAEVVQLKATESIGYIKHALDRYPDIKIITTSEAAHALDSPHLVIDSGISDRAIEKTVGHAISHAAPDFLDAVVDSFSPLYPLAFIVATEGFKVAVGTSSVEESLVRATDRSKRSLTGGAAGAVFYAMGFGWMSVIPAVLAAKAGPEGVAKYIAECFEKAGDKVIDFDKWIIESKRKANSEMPPKCISTAEYLNRRAKEKGLDATFTPEDIQREVGELGAFSMWNGARIAYHGQVLYSMHPAVKAENARRLAEMQETYRKRLEAIAADLPEDMVKKQNEMLVEKYGPAPSET